MGGGEFFVGSLGFFFPPKQILSGVSLKKIKKIKKEVGGKAATGKEELTRNGAGMLGGSSAAEHSSVRAKASHFPKHCRHMAPGALKPLETKMARRS